MAESAVKTVTTNKYSKILNDLNHQNIKTLLPETEGATFQTLQCEEVTSSKWKRKLYTMQNTKLAVERMMVARARYLYLMVTSTPPALLSSSLWLILHELPESLESPI